MSHTEIVCLKLGNYEDSESQELLIHVDFDIEEPKRFMDEPLEWNNIKIKNLYIVFKDKVDDPNPTRIELPKGLFTVETMEFITNCIKENFTPGEIEDVRHNCLP